MGRASAYEQRLKELQKETERLRKDIRSVSKDLRRSGVDTSSLPRSAPRAAPSPVPSNETLHETVAAGVARQEPVRPPVRQEQAAQRESAESRAADAMGRKPVEGDQRFTNYLSSGSFGKKLPLTHERRVMRNRAIFMLLFAAIATALVYRFLF